VLPLNCSILGDRRASQQHLPVDILAFDRCMACLTLDKQVAVEDIVNKVVVVHYLALKKQKNYQQNLSEKYYIRINISCSHWWILINEIISLFTRIWLHCFKFCFFL
jgi:hypothetical protein